jgi:hypothetical protein
MDRPGDNDHADVSPPSSRLAAVLQFGPTGALAAHAAAALIREELAHALAAPTSFLSLLVCELEAGREISSENLGIAREEITRLRRLVSSLRAMPNIRVAPGAVRLAPAVRAASREVSEVATRTGIEAIVVVDANIVVSVDPTALGFVVFSVIGALASAGVARVHMTAEVEPAAEIVRLRIAAEECPSLDARVFASRAWVGTDGDALTFAIARRVARASGMRLRAPTDVEPWVVRLDIPLPVNED